MGKCSAYYPINKHGVLVNGVKSRDLDISYLEVEDDDRLILNNKTKLINVFATRGYFVEIELTNKLSKRSEKDILEFLNGVNELSLLLDCVVLCFYRLHKNSNKVRCFNDKNTNIHFYCEAIE